jgi:putative ABC transport system ATP-binding protein
VSTPLVCIEHLSKRYGRGPAACQALSDVSFNIDKGEWISIMGPSGSGKTTLLNIIGALDAHYQGSVRIGDQELRGLSDKKLSRFRGQTLGFIFQQFNLLPHLSVLENVQVPGFFNSIAGNQSRERATGLLERMSLSDKLKSRPTELSGGQQQRVAIARALFNRANLLLCDEPTGALDKASGDSIMELFTSLNRDEQLTLIVVTHEEHIGRMGERIIQLEDGRTVEAR